MIESVPGSEAAAPTPMITRPTIRTFVRRRERRDERAAQKSATPPSRSFLRPRMSPSVPPVSISAANASM